MLLPHEIDRTLRREQPPFMDGLARGLRLDDEELHELTVADWQLWTPWIVSTFSSGERTTGILADQPAVRDISEKARALLVMCRSSIAVPIGMWYARHVRG